MKKEMSAFDIHSMANELSVLSNGHIDKIFQWDFNVLLRINVKDQGKKDVFFKDGKWLYMPENKPETPITPQSFATFLRKYIDNARIGKVYQVGFDRIIVMEVLKADSDYKLIFELFGGGNVLLVLDGKIVNCLVHKKMKERSMKPGEDYVMPKTRFDPTSSPFDEFVTIIKGSESDTVRTLATMINLGGQYAEEVCKRSNVDKKTNAKELTDDDLKSLYDSMMSIAKDMERPSATMYSVDDDIVEISPIDLSIYDSYTKENFESLSKGIDKLMSKVKLDKIEEYVDPEQKKLQRRIDKQRETVNEYSAKADGYKAQGDFLYTEYQRINELLEVMSQQSKILTWEKLKEGAKKIDFVESVDPSKNLITIKQNDMRITLDYTKGLDANASDLYQKGKEFSEKAKKAEDALKESEALYAKKSKHNEKTKAALLNKVQPTKQFWFERYKWFFTPSGKMVIAGRDAHSNDNIVKKHLKDEDTYSHADLHGAPSTILKGGRDASEEDLREACNFALAHSKGWIAAMTDGTAYWVYTDQVSKTPDAGQFIARGAFIIRGKRNYEYHLPIELAIGEIVYQNERKIMCGPTLSVSKMSDKYFVIRPGRGKAGKISGPIAKEFNVPEEEISRIMPPGDAEIVKKVWPEQPVQEPDNVE